MYEYLQSQQAVDCYCVRIRLPSDCLSEAGTLSLPIHVVVPAPSAPAKAGIIVFGYLSG